jgi:hypothetical protein
MPVRTPEPRLPLEPEEYPIYRPPSRVGCSGLSIVTLVTLFVFALLFWRITPPIVRGITDFNPVGFLSGDQTTPEAGLGEDGAMATQTVEASAEIPTATPLVAVSPTPARQCVRVAGTAGAGAAMRVQPKADGKRVVQIGDGATLQVIGQDVISGKDTAGKDIVWMAVQLLPPDGRGGYVLGKFLESVPCP